MNNDVSALEIDAYVDNQLDLSRRFVVETHLSRHPDQAAQVMADLSTRSALQLIVPQPGGASDRMTETAARLRAAAPRPLWRRSLPVVGTLAAAASLALVFLRPSGPPDYIDYAVNSHRIAMMRAAMVSQVETPHYNAREIASNTRIAMPHLPKDWRVTDVQLFPTERGPALVVAVRTNAGEDFSLFALRERSRAPERPDAVREGAESVAYWRRGDISYALTGSIEPQLIDATAEALTRDWS
ncbi:anti-sigma factor [Sphingobium sp. BYY-5]|uniref:anti-sigma factor family protein n=1 Tax=Sphingobium sp. BYY-5 TaxID=2926400 RepID=UPI001FA740BE|nr:anti-sigma factor [Sphingobium sp. BYY-5]MCI4591500.1 anti-sigma factor [Sphingobium sp. BYY-5]